MADTSRISFRRFLFTAAICGLFFFFSHAALVAHADSSISQNRNSYADNYGVSCDGCAGPDGLMIAQEISTSTNSTFHTMAVKMYNVGSGGNLVLELVGDNGSTAPDLGNVYASETIANANVPGDTGPSNWSYVGASSTFSVCLTANTDYWLVVSSTQYFASGHIDFGNAMTATAPDSGKGPIKFYGNSNTYSWTTASHYMNYDIEGSPNDSCSGGGIVVPGVTSTAQYKSDHTTSLGAGSSTTDDTVVLAATLTSSSSDALALQVEVEPSSTAFTNSSTTTSASVSSGGVASAPILLANGAYHWQARALDVVNNATSSWRQFSANATGTDFVVAHYGVYVASSSVKALYHLDGNYLDNSGNANNGTAEASTTFKGSACASGYPNAITTPSGNIGVSVPANGDDLNLSEGGTPVDITVGAWAHYSAESFTTNSTLFGSSVGTGANKKWFFAFLTNDTFEIQMNDGGSTVEVKSVNAGINQGDCVFMAVRRIYTGGHSYWQFYKNGEPLGPTQEVDISSSPNAQFEIGDTGDGSQPFLVGSSSGTINEVFVIHAALSTSTLQAIYNNGTGMEICTTVGCNVTSTVISLSSLNQYKSDATSTINYGSSTTESYVTFGATLDSAGTSTLQLQIEVQPSSTAFTNTPNATSSYVSPGSNATATFGDPSLVYPRDPESWSNGSFHWQARTIENGTGATSTWETFGPTSVTGTVDFKINVVPEYMQKYGPWPSYASTTAWHDDLFDGTSTIDCGQPGGSDSTIGYCGCTISTVAMWLRYFGITTDTLGEDVNPGTLNTWLTNHGGYEAVTGNLNWIAVEGYASSTSGNIIFSTSSLSYDGASQATLRSFIDSNLSSGTPNPVILSEVENDHDVIATGFAKNAGTSTYTIRDSAWYDTEYLNQATSTDTSSTIYGYKNHIDGIRIFFDPPTLPLQAEYHVNLPNGIMLVDSQGRRTGKDPATGSIYREIPDTEYGEDCRSKTNCAGELITTDLPDGQYTFYILGSSTGEAGLSVYNNRGLSQVFHADIQPGAMSSYAQNYESANFANSRLFFESTVSSTASLTLEPAHNLPLPPAPQPVLQSAAPIATPIPAPSPPTSSVAVASSTLIHIATSSLATGSSSVPSSSATL